jgi:Alw26I/Eco31I/Esp3I family type II restriction m6 adenine DNA methyltransferase
MMDNEFGNKISAEYYSFLRKYTKTTYQDTKLLGKYYTDFSVADDIVNTIDLQIINKNDYADIKIIDPFCGDGRLVLLLLKKMVNSGKILQWSKILITLWEIDSNALKIAEKSILEYCQANSINYEINLRNCDAFVEYRNFESQYDICITNPPWCLLKPQKTIDSCDVKIYRNILEQYDMYIKEILPMSQPSSKFGKWGTNLARCGIEVALRLINEKGICGIVSPASLFNDQVSVKLRKWIFNKFNILKLCYYPAELKLYGKADIASVTAIFKRGLQNKRIPIHTYDNFKKCTEEFLGTSELKFIQNHNYAIPLKTGIDSIEVMIKLERLPSVKDYCERVGLSFTRELDETRIKEKLTSNGNFKFVKGYMVDRYIFKDDNLYLNEELVSIPTTANLYKLVWRDVSRDSQVRRIKAMILPPGYVCGNSLGVIVGSKEQLPYMKTLLAVMNSIIFEYQARSMLVSNHVSVGIIKKIKLPSFTINYKLVDLVNCQLKGENEKQEIELLVTKLYGVSVEEYKRVLRIFKFSKDEIASLLERYIEIKKNNKEINYDK